MVGSQVRFRGAAFPSSTSHSVAQVLDHSVLGFLYIFKLTWRNHLYALSWCDMFAAWRAGLGTSGRLNISSASSTSPKPGGSIPSAAGRAACRDQGARGGEYSPGRRGYHDSGSLRQSSRGQDQSLRL